MSQIHEVTVTMTNDEFKLYREWLDGHKSQEEILMTTTDEDLFKLHVFVLNRKEFTSKVKK